MTFAQSKRNLHRAMDNALAPHGFTRKRGASTWSFRNETAEIRIELQKSRGNPYYYLNAAVQLDVSEEAVISDRVMQLPASMYEALDLRTPLNFDVREKYFADCFRDELIPLLLPLSTVEGVIVNWHKSPLKGMGRYFYRTGLRGGLENNIPTSIMNPSRFRSFVFTKKEMDAERYDSDPAYAATLDYEQQEIALLTRFVYALHLELVSRDNRLTTYRSWLLGYFETVRRIMEFSDLVYQLRTNPNDVDPDLILGVAVWNSVCKTVDEMVPFQHSEIPKLIPVKRDPSPFSYTHHTGKYAIENQFWGRVVMVSPSVTPNDTEITIDDWEQKERWYAVLHKFDSNGKHLETDHRFIGVTADGEARVFDRAESQMEKFISSLIQPEYGDIAVQLFNIAIDRITFGMEDTSSEQSGVTVTMRPDNLTFHSPWNGEYTKVY